MGFSCDFVGCVCLSHRHYLATVFFFLGDTLTAALTCTLLGTVRRDIFPLVLFFLGP